MRPCTTPNIEVAVFERDKDSLDRCRVCQSSCAHKNVNIIPAAATPKSSQTSATPSLGTKEFSSYLPPPAKDVMGRSDASLYEIYPFTFCNFHRSPENTLKVLLTNHSFFGLMHIIRSQGGPMSTQITSIAEFKKRQKSTRLKGHHKEEIETDIYKVALAKVIDIILKLPADN